jgi:hypothetical protein
MAYIINYCKHCIPCFTACVLNQSKGYWFLNDALHIAISMSLKLKEGMNHLLVLDAFIDDDSNLNIELGTFARNVKKEVCGVIIFFLSFLKKYDAKRIHNIFIPNVKS